MVQSLAWTCTGGMTKAPLDHTKHMPGMQSSSLPPLCLQLQPCQSNADTHYMRTLRISGQQLSLPTPIHDAFLIDNPHLTPHTLGSSGEHTVKAPNQSQSPAGRTHSWKGAAVLCQW